MPDEPAQNPVEQFTRFWTDFMNRSGAPGESTNGSEAAPAFGPAARQMQRILFDAMSKYAEDFMRSEQYLKVMKQTMDQSLAFKRVMDDFLTQAHRGVMSPTRDDVDDIASLLRGIEERVFERLGRIEERVAAMEAFQRSDRGANASPAQRRSVDAGSADEPARASSKGSKGKRP